MQKNYKVFVVGIFVILSLNLVFASEDYVFKWQLCDALNQSKINCDIWWNAFKINMGIVDNQSTNTSSVNLSGYYAKADVDNLIKNLNALNQSEVTRIVSNIVGNSTPQQTVNLSDIDAKILALRDSVAENYVEKDELNLLNQDENNFTFNPIWVLIGVIVIGGAYYMTQKNRASQGLDMSARGIAPQVNRRIQDKKELKSSDDYEDLKKEIEELKRKEAEKLKKEQEKSKKKKKDFVDEEIEDEDSDDEEEE